MHETNIDKLWQQVSFGLPPSRALPSFGTPRKVSHKPNFCSEIYICSSLKAPKFCESLTQNSNLTFREIAKNQVKYAHSISTFVHKR
jgi:hypothetical protein